ncbi:MAG: DUF1800 domain-containing protein [Methylobacteriaceae bacterium]|nr:DUF1800 domain-containing protein [Methylobacteriaceae bacterium]
MRRVAGLLVAWLVGAGQLLAAAPPASIPPAPLDDVAFLNALTWGVTSASLSELRAEGRERWLARQLRPAAVPSFPPAVQTQLDALRPQESIQARLAALDEQGRAERALLDPEARKAAQAAIQASLNDALRSATSSAILRALYSPDQLRERLTWFWLNRFSLHSGKGNIRAMAGDYLDAAIRPHALGRFRDLLEATLRHPAMLRYLDNAENAVGRVNENYARELLELHTMGVGSGYGQADVEALARILTGAGIDLRPDIPLKPEWRGLLVREGAFAFNPARHDFSDKTFLGQAIRGSGYGEIAAALDIVSRRPATARNVSRALAAYLQGTPPSDALVERLAQTFLRTDGDIASVVAALVRSPDFAPGAGGGFKDPVRYVLSAVRLAYEDRSILNPVPVQNWLNRLGEGLFNRSTPDGYPLAASAWTGPGQLAARFEVARQIGSGPAGLFKPAPDAPDEPGFPVLQNALYFSTLAPGLGPATKAALARAVSPQDWNTLFLASPEFMR